MTSLNFFSKLVRSAQRTRRDDEGGLTIFGLYIFAAMVVIGGIAVDVSHLIAEHTKLQMTADLSAHAALYNRDSMSEEDAIDAALNIVSTSMPDSEYGTVLTRDDILFGSYDRETSEFTIESENRSAVLVSMRRRASTGNAVASFLMQFVGIDQWDMTSQAVFATYRPACLREGFVAEGIIDLQSNNGFFNGFCIHSNTYVSLNGNNTFEAGTVVSMPDLDDLELPSSGFETNDGLETALRESRMHIRVLNQLDEIRVGLLTYGARHNPPFITDPVVYEPSGSRFDPTDFVAGTMNYVDCNSSMTLNGGTYSQIVIVAECKVKFGNGVILQDVTIMTRNTRSDSFTSPSGLQVGRDDDCGDGGGAQLITNGGMSFASGLQVFGGQLIALRDIEFSANANGIQGASMIAGGEISGTSNMSMAFCKSGMENNFEAEYFRLAL